MQIHGYVSQANGESEYQFLSNLPLVQEPEKHSAVQKICVTK